jgi:predicted RNA-binding protein with PIN domain
VKPLVVVDAANVIGSRPDGWWRDRGAAAKRLLAKLAGSPLSDDSELVVILEGKAREGAGEGLVDGVRVEHADHSGDDKVVDVVEDAMHASPGRPVTVVTSDRGLRERVSALGAQSVGAHWLWGRVDDTGSRQPPNGP